MYILVGSVCSLFTPIPIKDTTMRTKILKTIITCSKGEVPQNAVQWSEVRGGPVAVADAGGGARWVRTLHHRAHVALLLWRPSPYAPHVPPWMEDAKGYVLAAPSVQRLLQLIANDTKNVIPNYFSQVYFRRRLKLQFNSRAPIVLAVNNETEICNEVRKVQQIKRLTTTEASRILFRLWRLHQSLGGLLVLEMENGAWNQFSTVPWAAKEINKGRILVRGDASQTVMEKNFLPDDFPKSLKGAVIYSLTPTCTLRYTKREVTLSDLNIIVAGPIYSLFHELTVRLRITMNVTKETQQIEKCSLVRNSSIDYENWMTTKILALVTVGTTEFVPIPSCFITSFPYIPVTISRRVFLIMVPRARPLPAWSLPLRVFGGDVWGAWLGTQLAYMLAWSVLSGVRAPLAQRLARGLAAAGAAFSSRGSTSQGRVRANPQRLQLGAALLASGVVLIAAYQGQLYTLMTDPTRYPEIDTLQQLADSGLPVVTWRIAVCRMFEDSSFVMETSDRNMMKRLSKNVVVDGNVRKVLERLHRLESFALLDVDDDFMLLLLSYPRLRELLHTVDQSFGICYSGYLVRRNWPWATAFQKQILRFQSAGLLDFWEQDFSQKISMIHRVLRRQNENTVLNSEALYLKGPRPFTLSDIQPPLQLLLFGTVAATLIFTGERLMSKKTTTKESK